MQQAPNYMPMCDVVQDLYDNLPPDDLAFLRDTPKSDLIQFHMSVGRRIRNYYRLWDANNPYVIITDEQSPFHPDQWSQTVIELLWEKVQ